MAPTWLWIQNEVSFSLFGTTVYTDLQETVFQKILKWEHAIQGFWFFSTSSNFVILWTNKLNYTLQRLFTKFLQSFHHGINKHPLFGLYVISSSAFFLSISSFDWELSKGTFLSTIFLSRIKFQNVLQFSVSTFNKLSLLIFQLFVRQRQKL